MNRREKRKWEVILIILIVLMLIFTIGMLVTFQSKMKDISKRAEMENPYEKYYVLLTNDSDSILWDSIYQGALDEGMKDNGAYIEYMGKNDGTSYSIEEKLEIAIDSKVDGIIIKPEVTDEMITLINKASGNGIPVVTVLEDAPNSLRKCFVGVNNYNLGEEYGDQLWELMKKEERDYSITILMNTNSENTGRNTTYLGIKESLDKKIIENSWNYKVNIKTIGMEQSDAFGSDEEIQKIVVDENTTDIIVCLSAVDTEAVYRTVVDNNKVGLIQILGYYESEDILEAVEKEIINSTVTVSGEQVGKLCVEALKEYEKNGYVNGYFPVDIQILDKKSAVTHLLQYQEESR